MGSGESRVNVECRAAVGRIVLDHQLTERSARLMDESFALEGHAEDIAVFLQTRKPAWRHR